MSTIRIQTAQNVTLEYEIASAGERILAALIDYGLYAVWFVAFALLQNNYHFAPDGRAGLVVMYLPTTFYMLACEVFFNGQTLGKRARDLRVVRLDGTRAGLGDYLLRWLLPHQVGMVAQNGLQEGEVRQVGADAGEGLHFIRYFVQQHKVLLVVAVVQQLANEHHVVVGEHGGLGEYGLVALDEGGRGGQ
ncbi:MAG: RDD family protein, partial [Bacteroidota bacterium]|nr:RDD family protein [Bacteroidota bacterium]